MQRWTLKENLSKHLRGIVHCCTCQPPGDPNPSKFTQTNTHVPDLCLAAVFGFVDLFRQVPSANSGATNQILAFPLCDHYISFT